MKIQMSLMLSETVGGGEHKNRARMVERCRSKRGVKLKSLQQPGSEVGWFVRRKIYRNRSERSRDDDREERKDWLYKIKGEKKNGYRLNRRASACTTFHRHMARDFCE
jgi:hypothetical protein